MREVNGFLRGWAGYFRYGNSARQFDKISTFAVAWLALFLAKRHKTQPGLGNGGWWPTRHQTASG